jgi:hypothetical protein
MEPTLFDDVDPASPLGRDEAFGPILSVMRKTRRLSSKIEFGCGLVSPG